MDKKIVLAILEQCEQGIRPCSFELLQDGYQIAQKLDASFYALLPGHQTPEQIPDLAYFPVDKIILMDHPKFEDFDTTFIVTQIRAVFDKLQPQIILTSGTPLGKDFSPRLAAETGSSVISDCVMVQMENDNQISVVKPTYNENFYSTYLVDHLPVVICMRPDILGIEKSKTMYSHQYDKWDTVECPANPVRQIAFEKGDPAKLDLREAELILSGGSGVSDQYGWDLLSKTANLLGASVGGSRPAVDNKFVSKEKMVGQTGKSVKTRLYLAAGISGVYYHLRAIDTEHLIALNTDKHAPIFKDAKLGIIGDVYKILPEINQKLTAYQESKDGGSPC